MALPGVFQSVLRNERVLVDGGTVKPVPYGLLMDECDLVIGIDVSGERTPPEEPVPPEVCDLYQTTNRRYTCAGVLPRRRSLQAGASARQDLKQRLTKLLSVVE